MTSSTLLHIPSYAKINLFLRVMERRPDGYHNLLSLMCCLDLADELELDGAARGLRITCDDPAVPTDRHNTAWRAARLFFDTLGIRPDLRVHITKKIPVAAGLGGGSSNAAALLKALNRIYGNPLSEEQLMATGRRVGADVPFFIYGRPAWAAGIGDRLREARALPSWSVLLINPGFAVSTALTFKNLNLRLTNCKQKLKHLPLKLRSAGLPALLCNDLETVTAHRHPEIDQIKTGLLAHGAAGALMSGSGPTVFGLFADHRRAAQARAALACNRRWRFFLTRLRT